MLGRGRLVLELGLGLELGQVLMLVLLHSRMNIHCIICDAQNIFIFLTVFTREWNTWLVIVIAILLQDM